jgi:hypothetical protein
MFSEVDCRAKNHDVLYDLTWFRLFTAHERRLIPEVCPSEFLVNKSRFYRR